MDPNTIHDKVGVFAQQLLIEAKGDPLRALGLLVLVLDGPELLSLDHSWRLVTEVRRLLMPEPAGESPLPIRHLVGAPSWEGEQHCLRCGKVLIRPSQGPAESPLQGYVFEIGPRVTSEPPPNYRLCS